MEMVMYILGLAVESCPPLHGRKRRFGGMFYNASGVLSAEITLQPFGFSNHGDASKCRSCREIGRTVHHQSYADRQTTLCIMNQSGRYWRVTARRDSSTIPRRRPHHTRRTVVDPILPKPHFKRSSVRMQTFSYGESRQLYMLIALLLVREGRVRRGQLGEKERSDGHGNDASVTVVPVSVHLVCCYACQVTEYSK